MFLHADTQLPAGALARLNAREADTEDQAGEFRHRFSGDRWSLRFVSWLDNFRCRNTRIIYGDQAMFVRRSLFRRLGGFPLEEQAITDSRKFEQMGVWRSLFRVAVILTRYELGRPIKSRRFFSDIR